MNWLDYLLIAVLAFSTVRSFLKGFTREIVGLVAALCALVLAMWFYGLAGSYISPYVGAGAVANAIGFAHCGIGVLIAGSLTGWIVSRFVRTIGLSFFDRLLGAAFGFCRGLLDNDGYSYRIHSFRPAGEKNSAPSAVVHSRIAPWVLEASHMLRCDRADGTQAKFLRGLHQDIRQADLAQPADKESGEKMKESFDASIDLLVSKEFFLEQAVEILEKGMIERVLVAERQQSVGGG